MVKRESDSELPEGVRVTNAMFALKIKVGAGGFDPEKIRKAEKTLDQAAYLFPSIAEHDIANIRETIRQFHDGIATMQTVAQIRASSAELRSHSTMLQFPLVSLVADSLLRFCESVEAVTMLVEQVVVLHVKALHIAMSEGPRAINDRDRVELLDGLEKACVKALDDMHKM